MKWFKNLKFIGLAILVSLGGLVQANAQTKKPNILVIWGDDIGQSNISVYTMGLVGYPDEPGKPSMGSFRLEQTTSCLISINQMMPNTQLSQPNMRLKLSDDEHWKHRKGVSL